MLQIACSPPGRTIASSFHATLVLSLPCVPLSHANMSHSPSSVASREDKDCCIQPRKKAKVETSSNFGEQTAPMVVDLAGTQPDVILEVGRDGRRLHVSSMFLTKGPAFFKAMLGGHFKESQNLSTTNPALASLPEDDPDAVEFICRVLHHSPSSSSRQKTASYIADIAVPRRQIRSCQDLRACVCRTIRRHLHRDTRARGYLLPDVLCQSNLFGQTL